MKGLSIRLKIRFLKVCFLKFLKDCYTIFRAPKKHDWCMCGTRYTRAPIFFSPEDSSGMKWVTLFFSYKNKLYKNNEVEIGEIIRTN